jgi:tetratricopeptide (TPR) repeat protein
VRSISIAAFVTTLWLGAAVAQAQPEPQEVARGHYERGVEAIEDARWSDALAEFQRSYEIWPTPPALFNAGLALRALGRVREARDVFSALLEQHPDADAAIRAEAEELERTTSQRIGRIEIAGLPPPSSSLRIRLDGVPHEDGGARPLRLEVDPGDHALVVSQSGYDSFEWDGVVDDGGRERIQVRLERSGVPVWVWIVAGAGALVAAGIVATVLVATRENTDSVLALPMVSMP